VTGLEAIKRFRVGTDVVEKSIEFLRTAGKMGYEGLVLWVGELQEATAVVTMPFVPKQFPMRSEAGIGIYIDADTLYEMNVWLHRNRLRLLAQVHSHGEHAYHSDTDNSFSIVTTVGALSIVVPHFAKNGFALESCAVYRLHLAGWMELSRIQARQLIMVT
jgi:hypothetical protein